MPLLRVCSGQDWHKPIRLESAMGFLVGLVPLRVRLVHLVSLLCLLGGCFSTEGKGVCRVIVYRGYVGLLFIGVCRVIVYMGM